jgi:hypothetical protein
MPGPVSTGREFWLSGIEGLGFNRQFNRIGILSIFKNSAASAVFNRNYIRQAYNHWLTSGPVVPFKNMKKVQVFHLWLIRILR